MIFLVPLPPPVHGSSVVGQNISNSEYLREKLNPSIINISTGGQNVSIFARVIATLKVVILSWRSVINTSDKVYISIAVSGLGLLKDLVIILPYVLLKKTVIYHFHNRGIKRNGEGSYIYRVIYRFLFHNNYAIVLDDSLINECLGYFDRKKIFVCNNGISPPDREVGISDKDTLSIIYLGNLIKEKGILLAIDVWQELYTECKTQMHVVGGEYDVTYEDIESLLSEGERSSLHLHGPKFDKEKFDVLAKCDIIVFPSSYRMELFPLVLLEALSQGVIPVAFDVGAVSRIFSDNEGWHVKGNDKDAFRNQLHNAIRDEKIVHRKKACIELFKNRYTLEKFEKTLCQIIENI